MSGSGPESIRFSSSPDAKDWISGYWLTIRDRWLWRRIFLFLIILWLLYIAAVVCIDVFYNGFSHDRLRDDLTLATLFTPIVAAGLILLTLLITPRRVRKVVRDAKRLAPETHFEVDGIGLRSRNAVSTSTLSWSQFERWLENSRVMVLMVTGNSFYIIRKSELDPGVSEKLRALLVAAEVPTR